MGIIPVVLTINRNYVLPARVAIYSMLLNASRKYEYCIYVLHADLDESDKAKVCGFRRLYDVKYRISFVRMEDDQCIDDLTKNHFSKEIFYKLKTADLFPMYDKALFVDADVLFLGDVAEAYNIELDGLYYAGPNSLYARDGFFARSRCGFSVEERRMLRDEICAGFMAMNLAMMRGDGMVEKMTSFYKENFWRLPNPEQETLTLKCWPKVGFFPLYFMVEPRYYKGLDMNRVNRKNPVFDEDNDVMLHRFNDALNHPIQMHYVGDLKPWINPFVRKGRLWLVYVAKSGSLFLLLKKYPLYLYNHLKTKKLRRFLRKVSSRLFPV